ncbi:MAG: YihY/virulence factor BrkB family protein [Novosphingobium sp.]|nr:YihY/virulence factor BrkB family protein [Novosphingobium sp.]
MLDLSPEARRRRAVTLRGRIESEILQKAGPGTRIFMVAKRVWAGVYHDGFVHAGNFAYMALLSLFPFFIAAAAFVSLIGEQGQRDASINAILVALPRTVGNAIGPVARDVVAARQGWLLWVGGAFGLWTASSMIETIRDILQRSYGTVATRAFWQYRIDSMGVIFGSVVLLLLALGAQVAMTAVQHFLEAYFPALDSILNGLIVTRLVSAAVLFAAILVLFRTLTPQQYQGSSYPKWPGALFVAAWWTLLIEVLPFVLRRFFSYDLTYGSLAGVMIALFFFWLVGFGVVVGASLNAALAVVPEEEALIDEAGDSE